MKRHNEGEYDSRMGTAQQALDDALDGPAKASGDVGSMESHKLADLQAIADREAAKTAVESNKNRGLRFSRIRPAGTV